MFLSMTLWDEIAVTHARGPAIELLLLARGRPLAGKSKKSLTSNKARRDGPKADQDIRTDNLARGMLPPTLRA